MKNQLTKLLGWIDERFPLTALWKEHVSEYYARRTSTSGISSARCAAVLVIQIVSGIS